VLTRTMKKIEKQAGKLKRKVRDRTRSVNKRVRAIAMASQQKAAGREERRQKQYCDLLCYSRQIWFVISLAELDQKLLAQAQQS